MAVWAFIPLVGGAAIVNLLVDPYRLFRVLDVDHLNVLKPRAHQQVGLTKSRGIAAIRPSNLILGNSRAAIAFDTHSPDWPEPGPTYNAAIPGTGTASSLQSLKEAVAAEKVGHVLVGIEFFDFLVDPEEVPKPASEEQDGPWGKMLATTVLSLEALSESIITVAMLRRRAIADITTYGFNPMREYEAIEQRGATAPCSPSGRKRT